jgi:outer membrane protein OmpA-like peptidoglycan-associated protein
LIAMSRSRIDASKRRRFSPHGYLIVLVVAFLSLVACAAQPKRAPIASQSMKSANRVPGTVVLDPINHEQDKKRIKQTLGDGRDSLAPTEVGYYMDVLQGRLKQFADKRMAVSRHDDQIVLALSLLFEPDSPRLDSGVAEILAPLSSALVEYRKTLVSVHVAADDDTVARGLALSEQRARTVAQYFVKAGVHSKRIVIAGSHVNRPPVANLENRTRVELLVEPVMRSVSTER